MSQAQEHLKYNLRMSRNTLMNSSAIKNIIEYAAELQRLLQDGDINEVNVSNWTGGYVARDIAEVQALLVKHQALNEAVHIVVDSELDSGMA